MKKIILLCIFCFSFVLSSPISYSYSPSPQLQSQIEEVVVLFEGIIVEKWEDYRPRFLRILESYTTQYAWNERAQYILWYLYSKLQNNTGSTTQPNILLIIADDMGLDASPWFTEWEVKANMPNLEKMIDNGLVFENLWSAPTCTPTRSTILTGKYGVHTDMIAVWDILSTTEKSLQNYLDLYTNDTYSHAVIGKWHLSDDPTHPTAMWVDYYAGMLSGNVRSYWNWNFTENQKITTSKEYMTTKFTDLAIDWKEKQENPWFLWLAYTAPHTPFHVPPAELHSQWELDDSQESIDANPLPYYIAALEAMDSEMGRFLDSMTVEEKENTLIIFIGDNGTPNQVAQFPYSKRTAKGSLSQWGINVPMVVSGAWVSRVWERETTLVNTSDIFATVLDLANTWVSEMHDSKSFMPFFTDENAENREYIYAEVWDTPQSWHTIRDETYKLINLDSWAVKLYNLIDDPYETKDLLRGNWATIYGDIVERLQSKIGEIRN